MGKRQRQAVVDRLAAIGADEERVIVATGKYIGEGFDDLNRTGFIGGPIPREDGPDGTTQQVFPRAA